MNYEEACRWAITEQGLDPIIDRLTTERIYHYVEQTGGFCMVATVPLGDGSQLGITASERESEKRSDPRYLLVYYPTDDATPDPGLSQKMDGDDLTTDETVALVRKRGG